VSPIRTHTQFAKDEPHFGQDFDAHPDLHELHSENPTWHFWHTAVARTNDEPHFVHFPSPVMVCHITVVME
jgi:hypothetical protein